MKMATTGTGMSFGIGGWESQLVILFESNTDFEKFADMGLDATAEAGAMVGDDKEQLSHRFNEGKAVFMLKKRLEGRRKTNRMALLAGRRAELNNGTREFIFTPCDHCAVSIIDQLIQHEFKAISGISKRDNTHFPDHLT